MSAEHTEHSPTLGALAKALAAAQAKLEDAKKDATNPHFKNRYATLASVRAAVTPVLSQHGLSVVQTSEPHGEGGVCIVTTLLHESGEWIRGRLFLPVAKRDPQGFGSAISYARRYALAAIVNISSDDDDDANIASTPAKTQAAKPPTVASSVRDPNLTEAFASAKDQKEFGAALLAVGRAKDKLSDADLERLREAHDRRLRELSQTEAA